MMDPRFTGKPITATSWTDLDRMPDTPNRGAHHRRAQSETFFRLPDLDDDNFLDDINFDFNLHLPPSPTPSDTHLQHPHQLQPIRPINQPNSSTHYRSLSVEADFFADLDLSDDAGALAAPETTVGQVPRHRHSNSMDGSTSFEAVDFSKKAMAPERLAELALIDPKRAKRILANRQSAARSKERKVRYASELERKVQTLKNETITLSSQVTKLERDSSGLTAENRELKLRLQAMEQQSHLRDALSEALKKEVQHLKIAAGQIQAGNGSSPQTFTNLGGPQPQYPPQQNQAHSRGVDPNLSGRPHLGFAGFNQRF